MDKVLFLSAPLKERIWGGSYFKEVLNVTKSEEKIGEMWSLSAHPEGESIVLNGEYKNLPLSEVYRLYPEVFGNPKSKEFPILVKLIATSDDLSIQVHPDDEYARVNENQFGKTEGWLILDSKDGSIVIGHNAKNKEELTEYIQNDNYDELLNTRKVSVGEFYPINSGTVHALGKNLVIMEIQQSSDVTYRVYDYHRKDKFGNERELHVQKAIDVINYLPVNSEVPNYFKSNKKEIELWDNKYFTVNLLNVNGVHFIDCNFDYAIVSVCTGSIEVEGKVLKQGDSFIITSAADILSLKGKGKVTVTISKI